MLIVEIAKVIVSRRRQMDFSGIRLQMPRALKSRLCRARAGKDV